MAKPGLSSISDRSFKAAIDILRTRRRPRRPSTDPVNSSGLASIPDAFGTPQVKGVAPRLGMDRWLRRIGHSTADLDNLNVIHVAGTKGKGSTCAFAESFLKAYGSRAGNRSCFPRKTGMYTSPHLISYEERIRIDTRPISRDLFAKYFFEVWESLLATEAEQTGQHLPRYLQLLALVSMHAFIREGVEAAVFETHHGGEYDSTNVVENPVVTIVTSLGMDHVRQLGPGIENIAWHKAGIFKPGAFAVSARQDPIPAGILQDRAKEKGVELVFVEDDDELGDAPHLKPYVQRMNAAVALAAVREFIRRKAPDAGPVRPDDIRKGIQDFSWAGRFQVVDQGQQRWCLDGAHNELSIVKAAEWFVDMSNSEIDLHSRSVRTLIFNQLSDERDGDEVFECLAQSLKHCHFDYVLFTDYDKHFDGTAAKSQPSNKQAQVVSRQAMADIWRRYQKDSEIIMEPSVQSAVETVTRISEGDVRAMTLVTGSLHLVGSVLWHLQGQQGREHDP